MARRRLLSTGKENSKRFDFALDDDDFEEHTRGFVPATTAADTQKCMKLFEDWKKERNSLFPGDKVPEDVIVSDDKGKLCKWLCKFSMEARKKDGTHYPPKTIQHSLMGIQRHIRLQKQSTINLVSDPEFLPLRNLLDSLYRKLHSAGIGTSVKKTEVLSDEDEETLWASGVLNPDTPQGLLNCIFFLNGKNFCLRGGIEHRELKLSQFTREGVTINSKKLVRYTYTECGSKNRSVGLKQLQQANEVVEIVDIPRCHVLLMDKYMAKLPAEAKAKDIFYLKPKTVQPKDPCAPWFTAVPVGKNKLSEMMKTMALEGKLDKPLTNHSLRAYGVTKMFAANVSEKLMMERSGHRSIDGLRQYERTNAVQELQVCNALQSRKEVDMDKKAPGVAQPVLGTPSLPGMF